MSAIATAIVGSAVIGGITGSDAARKSANAQRDAAKMSADVQREMFNKNIELNEPWRKAGEEALNKLRPLAMEYTPFTMEQFQQDPGYGFRMSEGLKALERSASARGGLLGGAQMKAIQRYGQDMASQEYTNAFNRYQTERAARLQPLQSLAGVGQTTAQQIGNAGMSMANNVGEMMTSGAAARASGYVGQANALTGAINSGMNYWQNQQALNSLRNRGGPSPNSGFSYNPSSYDMEPINYSLTGGGP